MRPHWTRGRTDARYVIYLPSSSPLLPSSAVKKRSWQRIDPRASTSPFSCSQEKNHFGETPSPPPAGSVPTKKRGGGRLPSSLFIANLFSRSALKTKKHTRKMRGVCFFSFSNQPTPPFFWPPHATDQRRSKKKFAIFHLLGWEKRISLSPSRPFIFHLLGRVKKCAKVKIHENQCLELSQTRNQQ